MQRARERSVAFYGFLNAAIASYEEAFGNGPVFSKMKTPGLIGSEVPENLDSAMEIARREILGSLLLEKQLIWHEKKSNLHGRTFIRKSIL